MHASLRSEAQMATLTIRKLHPGLKDRLRVLAARHGRSMEEEVRQILARALADDAEPDNMFDRMRRHFVGLGGVDLELPPRRPGREPPDLS
jgi:plasmid stability protein